FGLKDHDRAFRLFLGIEQGAGKNQLLAQAIEMVEMDRAGVDPGLQGAGGVLGDHGIKHFQCSLLSGRDISPATMVAMSARPATTASTASISGASTPRLFASAAATGAVATPSASLAPPARISSVRWPAPSAMPN